MFKELWMLEGRANELVIKHTNYIEIDCDGIYCILIREFIDDVKRNLVGRSVWILRLF